jgi:hypothetical protein
MEFRPFERARGAFQPSGLPGRMYSVRGQACPAPPDVMWKA